ncbi:pantoate--beta-alanine ligase [Mycobacterium kansasii 732]|nr:pantoate--beta-alanine ligase [Mycobacterium kansasii 732]
MKTHRQTTFKPGELNRYSVPREVSDVCRALRHTGRRVMLVPTMGALHEGHLALVRAAKRTPGSVVVVSIFVNPLQFGAGEDLDAYPRTLEEDVAQLRAEGVEIVFAPTAAAMYPDGLRTTVQPGPLGADLEGSARPGHFAGVLTVVLKLLNIVRPDRAYFGEKDYQQLVFIRQLVADLNVDVQVVGVPTVREADGLAMSSRNRYLDPAQREAAVALSAALTAGAHAAALAGASARARWTRLARCSTPCPASPSTTWSCATPDLARRPPAELPGYWLRRVSAPPGCWTTWKSRSEMSPAPSGRTSRGLTMPNHLGGIDVTHNAEVEDPPRYGDAGGLALRRVGDHGRRLDGGRRSARG